MLDFLEMSYFLVSCFSFSFIRNSFFALWCWCKITILLFRIDAIKSMFIVLVDVIIMLDVKYVQLAIQKFTFCKYYVRVCGWCMQVCYRWVQSSSLWLCSLQILLPRKKDRNVLLLMIFCKPQEMMLRAIWISILPYVFMRNKISELVFNNLTFRRMVTILFSVDVIYGIWQKILAKVTMLKSGLFIIRQTYHLGQTKCFIE